MWENSVILLFLSPKWITDNALKLQLTPYLFCETSKNNEDSEATSDYVCKVQGT